MLLKCLKCETKLEVDREWCVCPQCGAKWPVSVGIPRFVQSLSYYWGEIGRNKARELLEAARNGSWVEAVRAGFPDGEMSGSLFDLQRASWLPMLGLDERSVALDIGSGYGTITHSISRSSLIRMARARSSRFNISCRTAAENIAFNLWSRFRRTPFGLCCPKR